MPSDPIQSDHRESLALAEQALAAARQTGNQSKVATALIDLGIACTAAGEIQRAAGLFEEAIQLARQIKDRSTEADALGNLGWAMLLLKHPDQAQEVLEQQLTYAREVQDRLMEKLALDRLAMSHSARNDPARARPLVERAVLLAREVGDRQHEASLLWLLAIQYSELNFRARAMDAAQTAVDLWRKLRSEMTDSYSEHLEKYRREEASLPPADSGPTSGAFSSSPIIATAWTAPSAPLPSPSLLRMAYSAGKSVAKFIGSGMKTIPAEIHQQRLEICSSCEHHTGLRCRVCGCFTGTKARMPHEECPIGKWSAQVSQGKEDNPSC